MRAADETAYCDFVSARRRSLLQTAFLFTGDWHAAEDLVQISLAKLYVAWTRVRRRDDMDAYIRRTLLNAYLDERRRPWRREQAVAAVPDQPTTAAELPDPGTRQRILAGLAAIPPRQRAALVLRFWADMSVEQVADLLHCSAGTVKSQTARGLERLREALGPDLLAELKEHR